MVVSRATSDAAVERLGIELAAALRQDPVRKRMRRTDLEPIPGGPADMQRLTAAERTVWVPLIRSLGIPLDWGMAEVPHLPRRAVPFCGETRP